VVVVVVDIHIHQAIVAVPVRADQAVVVEVAAKLIVHTSVVMEQMVLGEEVAEASMVEGGKAAEMAELVL
jgi:hypothetical protein